MRQSGLSSEPTPYLMDRGVGLPGLDIHEQVLVLLLRLQLLEDIEGTIIQRHRPDVLALAVGGRNPKADTAVMRLR